MPVSPADHEAYAAEVRRAYADAETTILARIARRVAQGIDADDEHWTERKLAEIRRLRQEVEAELRALGRIAASAGQAVAEAYEAGAREAQEDLAAAQVEVAQVAWQVTSRAAVETLVAAAVEALQAAHLRILRAAEDIYRQVIYEAARMVVTGVMTRREAAARALADFADRGITGFRDRAGRAWDLASYAEMAVRSATGQAAVQGHVDRLAAAGRDLVIVSDSPEECPLCRPWEGKVLSISGATPRGSRVQLRGRSWTTVAGTLQEAIGAGLFHPNCTHRLGLVVEGLTQPLRGVANPQGYEERQQQRYLERQIRKWKRREAAAITEDERRKARAKMREWQARMREFIDETDRRRLYYREQIGAR